MARTKQTTDLADAQRTERRVKRSRQKAELQNMKSHHFCSCRKFSPDYADSSQALSHCSVKRCIEPLAWNFDNGSPVAQTNCPLFTKIPKELRDLIFEYALTESSDRSKSRIEFNAVTTRSRNHQDTITRKPDRPENLLLTCWAIYRETYLLPVLLNPVRFPHFNGITGPKPKVTLPWQFANIQALDITLPQVVLEGDFLYHFLFGPTGWHPEARHKGAYVAPYVGLKNTAGGSCRSCDFTLLPTHGLDDRIHLSDALEAITLPLGFEKPGSDMRLQRARPLVHLTLRIPSRKWWTWTDEPSSTDVTRHHLGLEPALGDGSADLSQRPTCTRMQELAQQRRDRYFPVARSLLAETTPGWAHVVAKLPDIRMLELVLETFGEKKAQLETVIECAKTWRFPIADTQFELAWNGKIDEERWCKPLVQDWAFQRGEWYARSTSFEERTIRFTRRRMALGPGEEDCKVH